MYLCSKLLEKFCFIVGMLTIILYKISKSWGWETSIGVFFEILILFLMLCCKNLVSIFGVKLIANIISSLNS